MKNLFHYISPFLFLLFGCTDNAFFNDPITIDELTTIRGRVNLGTDVEAGGVYVWVDGFEYSTYTQEDGRFSIELPDPSLQPGGGLSGIFKVYFFCANYRIKSASFLLLNGKIERNKGDVDNDGKIFPAVWLPKLLDIQTELNYNLLTAASKDSLVIRVHLTNLADTVIVRTFRQPWGAANALVILSESGNPEEAILLKGATALWAEETLTHPVTWIMIYKFPRDFFSVGKYYFYPLLEVVQDGIPQRLLNSLGDRLYAFDLDYLNVPYKQTPGILEVR